MLHYRSLSGVKLSGAYLSIGSFDGVHNGHQEIVRRVVASARDAGVPAVVLTFYPHPAIVLGKRQDAYLLTTPDERASLLGELGVDIVITYPFTIETSSLSAEDFVSRLHNHLGFRHLFVGQDFALGRGREGNISRLTELGRKYNYQMDIVPPVMNGDIIVSSSQIRSCLFDGDVVQAARLMGRNYKISGQVVPGDARGKLLGIPTANLQIWAERAIPKSGVYVCHANVGRENWGAVANIGVRPTFENSLVPPRVEAHLLDFDRDLYGMELSLEFIDRLRDEKRFTNVDNLVDQIHTDISYARDILRPK